MTWHTCFIPPGLQLHQACLPNFASASLQHVSSEQQEQHPQLEGAGPLPALSGNLAHIRLPAGVEGMLIQSQDHASHQHRS